MSLKFENWDGVTAPTVPSGWTVDSPLATASSFLGGISPTSSPNALVLSVAGNSTSRYATWGTTDGNSGNVSVQASFNTAANTDQITWSLFARSNASATNRSTSTFYLWQLDLTNLNSKVFKINGGVGATLGTVSSITLATQTWYQATFSLFGSAITLTLQRMSDSKWLTSAGAFQTSPAVAHTITDSSITGSGFAGLALAARSDTVYTDDWTLSSSSSAASASLAATGGSDTLSSSAKDTAFGSLSGAGRNDTMVGIGGAVLASLAKTEGHDTASIAGWCVTAALSATERHDTLAGSGSFATKGSMAKTAGSDTMSGAGSLRTTAAMSKAEAGDTMAGAGKFKATASGSLAGGNDTLAGTANRNTSASASVTEHHDTLAATAHLTASGSIHATEQHDTGLFASSNIKASMHVAESGDTMRGIPGGFGYHVYSNSGAGDPINYTVPIATTGQLTWTSGTLAFPGTWSFGVRAYAACGEESNVDAAVTFILDASGIDITNRPFAPVGLRGFPIAGGLVKLEWTQPPSTASKAPTGFHLYYGISSVDYTTVRATVLANSAIAGHFFAIISGLTDGQTYKFSSRAFNSVAEEQNTAIAVVTADATGPRAVSSLTATAI